jgi:signal transduction histidine kinase
VSIKAISGLFEHRVTWYLTMVMVVPVVTFVVDISTNQMFVAGVLPYFLAVFGCIWTGGRRGLFFVTSLSIVFLAAATVLKHPMPDLFYFNRATLFVGLIIAALLADRAILQQPRLAKEPNGLSEFLRWGWGGGSPDFDELELRQLRELTEELRRARDDAEAANRAKSVFLANMSHELRTPLNSIIGFSQIMEGSVLGPIDPEKCASYATNVREAGQHLLGVINDILDVSRIESGTVNKDVQLVSVMDSLETVIRFCRPTAEKAGVLLVGPSSPHDFALRMDPRHMLQIGVNLVSNAIKFSDAGRKVEIHVAPENDQRVLISVTDSGPGIPEVDLERVFEPFVQLSTKLSREHQGTGLGLSIARSLVEMHGGTLHLESRLGVGTDAKLALPLANDALAQNALLDS